MEAENLRINPLKPVWLYIRQNFWFRFIVLYLSEHSEQLFNRVLVGWSCLWLETVVQINDGVSKGVNDGVKAELIKIVEVLDAQEGLNAQEVAEAIGKSKPTVERYLRIAKKLGMIEFKGASRTGGILFYGGISK